MKTPGEEILQSLPPELQQFAEHIGYTADWFDARVVDEPLLCSQYETFQVSYDKNPEHYRHRAFVDFVRNQNAFEDHQIDKLLALRDHGADGCDLIRCRLFEVIDALSADQLVRLRERHGKTFDNASEKYFARNLCCEVMRTEGVGAIFEEMQLLGDATLETYVLEFGSGLTRSQAEWLSVNGSSRKVRNIAAAKLRHKRNSRFEEDRK